MFLAGCTVAMVIYCVTKMKTCSPMIGQFFHEMIVASIGPLHDPVTSFGLNYMLGRK